MNIVKLCNIHYFGLFIAAMSSSALPQTVDSYSCVANRAAGFAFSDITKRWETVTFDVSRALYVIAKHDGAWRWTKIGSTDATDTLECKDFNEFGFMICQNMVATKDVTFNRRSYRYLASDLEDYVGGLLDRNGTVRVEIGNCLVR